MSVRPIARSLAVSRSLTREEVAMVSGADNMEMYESSICPDSTVITRPDHNSLPDEGSKRDDW